MRFRPSHYCYICVTQSHPEGQRLEFYHSTGSFEGYNTTDQFYDLGKCHFKKSSLENQKRMNEHHCWMQRVTQLVQITSPVVVARTLFTIKNHILLHRYFMCIFHLGYKDEVDVQELRSNVLAVDTTLSQAPSAKDFPVPGRSAVACSEPIIIQSCSKTIG